MNLRTFVEDADARSESEESLKVWLNQIKEVAGIIEDLLNGYILQVSQQPRERGLVINLLGKVGRLVR